MAAALKVGDRLPEATFWTQVPPKTVTTAELFAGKRAILFAVPGAFTPTCSKTHLPGYVADADKLKQRLGVTDIYCVATNDVFVMEAWAAAHNAAGKVTMLADPTGDFMHKIDLKVNLPPLGGDRYARFSMIVDNGVVEKLNVEPDGKGATCSLASSL